MGVCELRRAAKMEGWCQRICECRSSGQPVKEWCEEHGISKKTYYRWERLCIAEAINKADGNAASASLVRIEPEKLPESASYGISQDIAVQCGEVTIRFPGGASVNEVVLLVKALNHA